MMSEVLTRRDTEIYEHIHKHTHRDEFVSFLMTLNVRSCGDRDSQCTLLWEINNSLDLSSFSLSFSSCNNSL